jgi:hypothetical protein
MTKIILSHLAKHAQRLRMVIPFVPLAIEMLPEVLERIGPVIVG